MKFLPSALAALLISTAAMAQDNPVRTLITDGQVFDGNSVAPIDKARGQVLGTLITAASIPWLSALHGS